MLPALTLDPSYDPTHLLLAPSTAPSAASPTGLLVQGRADETVTATIALVDGALLGSCTSPALGVSTLSQRSMRCHLTRRHLDTITHSDRAIAGTLPGTPHTFFDSPPPIIASKASPLGGSLHSL